MSKTIFPRSGTHAHTARFVFWATQARHVPVRANEIRTRM